jgi:Ser/Thr protein kinase RdoA (MazF antagonist)
MTGDQVPLTGRLRDELGPERDAVRLASSPGSQVWRVQFSGEPAIVKQIVGARADARFGRELAALRVAADGGLAPAVLAADPGECVVVLEFLVGAVDRLPGWDAYAEALARLHALGGRANGTLPAATFPAPADVEAFGRLCSTVGVDVPAGALDELDALLKRLTRAPRTALLHGDPCVGNLLTTDGHVRFVDFEQAALGEGAAELSYLHIGFPTCWFTPALGAAEIRSAEAAYRTAWRSAGGVGEPGSVVDHCVAWLLRGDALVQRIERGKRDQFARLLAEDWQWGPLTGRQRLARRLDTVAVLAAAELPAISEVAAALRDRLAW